MAQLKDSIIQGNLRVSDSTLTDTLQTTTIKAPTASGGTTYGAGSNGQALMSNGTTTYWGNLTTYSGMTTAEIEAGTSTTNRLISPANLKTAVNTWAAVSEEDIDGMCLSSALTMNLNVTNSLFIYNQTSADSLKQFIPGYADPPYYGETHAVNALYDTSPAARYIKILPDKYYENQDMEFVFAWNGRTNSDSCLVQFLTNSNEVIASCTMENRDYNTFSSKLTFSQYPTKIRVYYTSTDTTAVGNVVANNLALIPYTAYTRLYNSGVSLTHAVFSIPFSSETAAYITGTSIEPLMSSLHNGINRDGSHNLLQCTATSRTHNGVVFTVNSDGTITANGTASGNAYVVVGYVSTTGGLFDGHHRLCGCPVGGSNTKYALYAASGNYTRYDYGQSTLLTPTTITGNMGIVAMVYSGTKVEDLVFKPMICHESDYAISGLNSYTQYAPTNRELYETILNLQSGIYVHDSVQVNLAECTWSQSGGGLYYSNVITIPNSPIVRTYHATLSGFGNIRATDVITPAVSRSGGWSGFVLYANTNSFLANAWVTVSVSGLPN